MIVKPLQNRPLQGGQRPVVNKPTQPIQTRMQAPTRPAPAPMSPREQQQRQQPRQPQARGSIASKIRGSIASKIPGSIASRMQGMNANKGIAGLPAAPATPTTPAPAPAPTGNQGIATLPAATPANTSMYTPHEGMLFGNDFYDRYAQNVGGQFKDPYHNFLMTGARDTDIPRLLEQYRASGRTDTPDWATLDTTGPISKKPILASKWDASGATPVALTSAWNSTTPLIEGVTVPEGYWDNYLAYNMNMSKTHPNDTVGGPSVSEAVLEDIARAKYAMSQGEYGNQGPIYNSYMSPKQLAQKMQSDQESYQRTVAEYNRQREANNEWARIRGVGVGDANSNLDARLAELEAQYNANRAQDAARQTAATQTQMNSARYAKGGIVNLRGK